MISTGWALVLAVFLLGACGSWTLILLAAL